MTPGQPSAVPASSRTGAAPPAGAEDSGVQVLADGSAGAGSGESSGDVGDGAGVADTGNADDTGDTADTADTSDADDTGDSDHAGDALDSADAGPSEADGSDDADDQSEYTDEQIEQAFTKDLLDWLLSLTPAEIVAELDKHIVGQAAAKRAVAVALRNRWRRQKVKDAALREEIAPNNLIMIGPTGVGKTEIARRMARLSGSPFVKVEASKFTEVGYVGRDVESMVRDLADTAVNMLRNEREETMAPEAGRRTEERLLDLLLPDSAEKPGKRPARAADSESSNDKGEPGEEQDAASSSGDQADGPEDAPASEQDAPGSATFLAGKGGVARRPGLGAAPDAPPPPGSPAEPSGPDAAAPPPPSPGRPSQEQETAVVAEEPAPAPSPRAKDRLARTREKLRALLRKGDLDDRLVEMEVRQSPPFLDAMANPSGRMEDMDVHFTEALRDLWPKETKLRNVTVAEARRILFSEELDQLVDTQDVIFDAMDRVEESGIIFLDEIDKIAAPQRGAGPDVSREGVQRDLLPVVEGCNVHTKYGLISTEHILFIAAGAFHVAKPSDLIPELQGRFPIRVELRSLNAGDFVRILKEPRNSLIRQYTALLRVEGSTVTFTDDGLEEVARTAADLNDRLENIGARRLQTVLNSVMEKTMFELPEAVEDYEVDAAFVRERLQPVVSDSDLTRYIL